MQKMRFIIPNLCPVNTQSGVTTIEILFESILNESGEILGIVILGLGIEIELFSSEKLENDTNFS
ncbi:MAG: hypothetical protein II988_05590 [Clostridia bacterium]|nr:hypothetical protein [Clostridia bacterium]